jgi:hypothetical protein
VGDIWPAYYLPAFPWYHGYENDEGQQGAPQQALELAIVIYVFLGNTIANVNEHNSNDHRYGMFYRIVSLVDIRH